MKEKFLHTEIVLEFEFFIEQFSPNFSRRSGYVFNEKLGDLIICESLIIANNHPIKALKSRT